MRGLKIDERDLSANENLKELKSAIRKSFDWKEQINSKQNLIAINFKHFH